MIGHLVRDLSGRTGRIWSVGSRLEVLWEDAVRPETVVTGGLSVLTMDSGWKPLEEAQRDSPAKRRLRVKQRSSPRGHNPFPNRRGPTKRGPGPRAFRNGKKKALPWTCKKAGAYDQVCTNADGWVKKVRVSSAWKKGYNREYKPWYRKQSWAKRKRK